ncbi:DEAD/DEAH box helicase [Onishia taeanensis]
MNARKANMLLPSNDRPSLRAWQARCIEQALQTLSDEHPHFLCQATPGAGKMLMAAVLAQELLQGDAIDYVIYLGPTTSVVERARDTLEKITGLAMHGRLGAGGTAFTYHALHHRLSELKHLCQQGRVLLVWDESHHAAGHSGGTSAANHWGVGLLALERQVRFTLALSGTPWRSDGGRLPLLRYLDTDEESALREGGSDGTAIRQQLMPDFIYSLEEAIRDQVCRYPRVLLVDNRDIQLTAYHTQQQQRATQHYASIPHLLRHPAINYSGLLRHDEPLDHVLTLGCQRLAQLRQLDPDAAGLVVASDIAHAEDLTQRLEDLGQSVCLITSKSHDAHNRLRAFRDSNAPWIVSVGMVSEGVDIPRLRVCCYLSHVRTEQHFRQVLGRIIRREGIKDVDCYLYALNEPYLRRYARRIADDLPDDLASVTVSVTNPFSSAAAAYDISRDTFPQEQTSTDTHAMAHEEPAGETIAENTTSSTTQISMGSSGDNTGSVDPDLAFSQAFIERLVALQLPST